MARIGMKIKNPTEIAVFRRIQSSHQNDRPRSGLQFWIHAAFCFPAKAAKSISSTVTRKVKARLFRISSEAFLTDSRYLIPTMKMHPCRALRGRRLSRTVDARCCVVRPTTSSVASASSSASSGSWNNKQSSASSLGNELTIFHHTLTAPLHDKGSPIAITSAGTSAKTC